MSSRVTLGFRSIGMLLGCDPAGPRTIRGIPLDSSAMAEASIPTDRGPCAPGSVPSVLASMGSLKVAKLVGQNLSGSENLPHWQVRRCAELSRELLLRVPRLEEVHFPAFFR
jgi:hypothetical protein